MLDFISKTEKANAQDIILYLIDGEKLKSDNTKL